MNGAEIRMLSRIHQLFYGMLLLLLTLPFVFYFSFRFGYEILIITYNLAATTGTTFSNGISVRGFEVGLAILIFAVGLISGSYYFTHSVFKYGREKGASGSGYLGSIFMFVGLLLLLAGDFLILLTELYQGNFNRSNSSSIPPAFMTLLARSDGIQVIVSLVGVIFSIAGTLLIFVELLKLSIKYLSVTLALGSVILFFVAIYFFVSQNRFDQSSIDTIYFAMSFTSLLLILFGLREVAKEIKGEKTASIDISYL